MRRILPGEPCIRCHAGDAFANTQSPDAEAFPSVTLHFFAFTAEHTHLHLVGMLMFSIGFQFVLQVSALMSLPWETSLTLVQIQFLAAPCHINLHIFLESNFHNVQQYIYLCSYLTIVYFPLKLLNLHICDMILTFKCQKAMFPYFQVEHMWQQ